MIKAGVNGAVTWMDLSTPDITAATNFYRDLLGWKVEGSPTPMGEYFIGKVADHQVGGMMQQGPELLGNPAMWTTFIYADDLEATVGLVEKAGGTIHEKPFDIPGDARIALVADPTGAMFGLFSGQEIEGSYYSGRPGAVCWAELMTRDLAAAETFYATLFGWKAETRDTGETKYTTFKLEGEDVAGMLMMPDMVPAEVPAHWGPYFTVADCAAAEKKALELGGKVLRPTAEIEIGKFAVIADPTGAAFNLMEFSS